MAPVIGIDARSAVGQPTGVGRYVQNLVRHLAREAGPERYELFLDRPSPPLVPEATGRVRQRILRLPLANNAFTWLQLRLPPSLWRRRVALFHFPFYTVPWLPVGPAVVTLHDVSFEVHPEWFSPRSQLATRRFARLAARRAAAILTVSEHSRAEIVRCYGVDASRVHVVYPAVPEDWRRNPGSGTAVELPATLAVRTPYVLHVGSIHTRRNLPRLLRAVARLRRGGSPLSVVLVGRVEWPYPDVAAMIEAAGMAGAAVHLGYVSDPALRSLYRGARALAYPSLYEGFGFPAVEAMALGTPVVASRTTCFPEVLGDAAILVDPEDEAAIADGLRRAAADGPERRALVERGRRRAAAFSWSRAAAATLAVYRQVLEERGAAA